MLRADYRESISQAVSEIRDMPSLEGRSKAAIAQAVVLRMLAAAGWDVFDLSQVMPGYITGNSNVDFALMSPPPGRPRGAVIAQRCSLTCGRRAKTSSSPQLERQLLAHCAREKVPLAALTNGLRWLLFLWSPGGGRMERRFCEIDLRGDPEAAAADVNRYLTRDRVSNGQAARSAERALRDSNRELVDRRAVIQGWRQVVVGLRRGSDRTGRHRCGTEGRLPSRQPAGPPGTGGESRRTAGTRHRGRRRVRPRRRPPLNTVLLHPGF